MTVKHVSSYAKRRWRVLAAVLMLGIAGALMLPSTATAEPSAALSFDPCWGEYPEIMNPPTISGTPGVYQTLTGFSGHWTTDGGCTNSYTFNWIRNTDQAVLFTSSTQYPDQLDPYYVQPAAGGHWIHLEVTAYTFCCAGTAQSASVYIPPLPPPPPPPPPPPAPSIIRNDADVLAVHNDDGDWYIRKTCEGNLAENWTTGPGYVYRLDRGAQGNLVDDERKAIYYDVGTDTSGGLGSFAYQHAEGNPFFFFYDPPQPLNAWPVTSRICAGQNVHSGFGVSRSSSDSPWQANDVIHWYVTVDLRSQRTDPVLRIHYLYEFHWNVVKVMTTVESLCGSGNCGYPNAQQFAKEPKFTAEVNRDVGYSHVVSSGTGPSTEHCGAFSNRGTSHDGHAGRREVRFDNLTCGNMGACAPGFPCLHVVALSVDDEPPTRTFPWESGRGLDGWANDAHYWPKAHFEDGPGSETKCREPTPPYPFWSSPAQEGVRRWELVGTGTADAFRFAAFFHGWEAGRGPNDCEPLARHFPSLRSYSNYFEYRVD